MNTNKENIEDEKKISQLFFYLQDISLEIQASLAFLQVVELTMLSQGGVFFNGNDGSAATLKIENFHTQTAMAKIIFHNILLNICRFNEAIKGCSKLLYKYCPEANKRFNIFSKKYCTSDVIAYRNMYVAHPFDKSENFIKYSVLISLAEKILNIPSFHEAKVQDFVKYVKAIHFFSEDESDKDPDKALSWAIYAMKKELSNNRIVTKRI